MAVRVDQARLGIRQRNTARLSRLTPIEHEMIMTPQTATAA